MVRALVVSNMRPDAAHPERGRFVRDQVAALRALGDVEVELFEFPPGVAELARAARALRTAGEHDVVHAHFGLTAWPALAARAPVRALTMHGTDLCAPRTRAATAAALSWVDLPAVVSESLRARVPRPSARRRAAVLPCGVDMERFRPIPRTQARRELGLDPDAAQLLFAADPSRPEKRYALARSLAQDLGVPLLTLGGVAPERVPLLVNAANAVLVPSAREGFGLAALEALACDVPVLATPVGVHPEALAGVRGALCAPFDLAAWRAALEPHLRAADPRVAGRVAASAFSAGAMAERVRDAWIAALRRFGGAGG